VIKRKKKVKDKAYHIRLHRNGEKRLLESRKESLRLGRVYEEWVRKVECRGKEEGELGVGLGNVSLQLARLLGKAKKLI